LDSVKDGSSPAASPETIDVPLAERALRRNAGKNTADLARVAIGGLVALLLTLSLVAGLWFLATPPAPVAEGSASAPDTVPTSRDALPPLPTFSATQPIAPTEVKPPREGLPAPIRPGSFGVSGISPDWFVIFRSHDPAIWNQNVRDSDQHFAVPLAAVPDDVTYLRVRHDAEFVVIEMRKDRLGQVFFTGDCGWNGENALVARGRHLGVFRKSERPKQRGDVCVTGPDIFAPYGGWGFGRREKDFDRQGYCWDGRPIAPAVLEIAVKTGGLTATERKQLMVSSIRIPPIEPPVLTGEGVSRDWTVVLRSADPQIWDREVNRDANHFALPLSRAPDDVRYLRIRKNAEYVVLPMTKGELKRLVQKGEFGWQGTALDDSHALHLGIFAKKMELNPVGDRRDKGDICIRIRPWQRGWGFGHKNWVNDGQGYCWDGKTIPPTVFEIAVKPGDLTAEEQQRLLTPDER
jgi:hypothetical protein